MANSPMIFRARWKRLTSSLSKRHLTRPSKREQRAEANWRTLWLVTAIAFHQCRIGWDVACGDVAQMMSPLGGRFTACCSIATLAGTSGVMMAALQWMNVIGVGAPTALRSAATTASGCGVAFALDCCDREAMSFLAHYRRHRRRGRARPDGGCPRVLVWPGQSSAPMSASVRDQMPKP